MTILPRLRRVIIESPYRATHERSQEQHELYLRHAVADCFRRNEAPFASHLWYPQVLDDSSPMERGLGIEAGWAWAETAEAIAVYADLGISEGMRLSIEKYQAMGIPIERRTIEQRIVRDILGM